MVDIQYGGAIITIVIVCGTIMGKVIYSNGFINGSISSPLSCQEDNISEE